MPHPSFLILRAILISELALNSCRLLHPQLPISYKPPVNMSSLSNHSATLHTGAKMPLLGLGTWKSKPDQIQKAIVTALQMGYRHLDCAAVYGNESNVGEALKEALALVSISTCDPLPHFFFKIQPNKPVTDK